VFFVAFDLSAAVYLVDNRAGAVCYNLAHAYIAPAMLLLSYVLSATRWCAFVGLLWAFHIAVDRMLGYGLKFAEQLPANPPRHNRQTTLADGHASQPSRQRAATPVRNPRLPPLRATTTNSL
jgi:hypothetical protein